MKEVKIRGENNMETPKIQPAAETSLPVWKAPEVVKIELRRTLFTTGSVSDTADSTVFGS